MKIDEAQKIGVISANERQVGGEHYKTMPIQPWDVMEAILTHEEFVGFLKGSYIKYAYRAGRKVDANDDVEKAEHFRQKLREVQSEI